MKRIWKIIIAVILCFAAVNLAWMIWREAKYSRYTDGMEKTVFSQLIVPRFACEDDEGFDYSVKYPDYLSFTGNLCVGVPDKVDGLIIWPLFGGGYEYGILVEQDGIQYQIYLDSEGNPVEESDRNIVQKCQDEIDILLAKAKSMWNLDL